MLRFARHRATALLLMALLATMPVLPILLCVCSAPASSDGCAREAGGAATWSDCCCDGRSGQPAVPSTAAVAGIATSPVMFAGASPTLARQIVLATAVDPASPLTRTHPLFKLFPAFLT